MSDQKIVSAVMEDEYGSVVDVFTRSDALNALVEIIRGEVGCDNFVQKHNKKEEDSFPQPLNAIS
jgi:hypothetical protein